MDILRIKHATGEVEIIMDSFFPTTVDKIKQLMQIIRLDWENQDNLREKLRDYFHNKLEDKRLNKTNVAKWERHLRLVTKEIEKLTPPYLLTIYIHLILPIINREV